MTLFSSSLSKKALGWIYFILAVSSLCNSSALSSENLRRRLQQETYQVPLFLALKYADVELTLPFESNKTSHEAVNHFCRSVNTQASGTQVTYLANSKGVTIKTNAQEHECAVRNTNRAYDNDAQDLLGPGFFILEIFVQQTVYVTFVGDPLSLSQVTSLVLAGFETGLGGRVKFRSLLKQDAHFSSILDVTVLSGGLSPPQLAPTNPPSSSQTSMVPSGAPTAIPTLTPTPLPSRRPPFGSLVPTTSAPTTGETSETSDDGMSQQEILIIAAIVGGVATIVVACFFMFGVWMPMFSSDLNERQESPRRGSQKRAHHYSSNAEIQCRLASADSFDDSSLFTSGFSVADVAPKSSNIDQVDSSYNERITIISTVNALTPNIPIERDIPVIPEEQVVTPVDVDDLFPSADDESLLSNESVYSVIETIEGDKDMAHRVSSKLSLGAHGYDPFDADSDPFDADSDSSYSFDEASSDREVNFLPSLDGGVSADRFFEETMGSFYGTTASSLLGSTPDPSSAEEDMVQRYIVSSDEVRDEPERFKDDGISDISHSEILSETTQANNDALLRNVLESARLLAKEIPSHSNHSTISRKSAPQFRTGSKTKALTNADLLIDTMDLRDYQSKPPMSSKKSHRHSLSAGDQPLRVVPPTGCSNDGNASPSTSSGSPPPPPSISRQTSCGSRDTTLMAGNTALASIVSDVKELAGSTNTGLEVREDHVVTSCTESEETPNPWLTDEPNDSPPNSIPPDADLDSAGATPTLQPRRKSDSIADIRDGDGSCHVGPTRTMHVFSYPDESKLEDSPEAGCFPLFSSEEETKLEDTREIEVAPRSLEEDLKRLEARLAEVMATPDTKTTSSITSSSTTSTRKRSKHCVVVVVPPGKIGIVLANRNDGKGTVVSQIRPTSSVIGLLSPGDKLLAVDDRDVSTMKVKEITSLMSCNAEQDRRLTVQTSNKAALVPPEEKHDH